MTETKIETVDGNPSPEPVLRFIAEKTGASVAPDQDIFKSGLSSMFAMELVVFLEQTYGISIVGADLQLDNFRTVNAMDALVSRLRTGQDG